MPKLREFTVMKEGKQYLGQTALGNWVAGEAVVISDAISDEWFLEYDRAKVVPVYSFERIYEIVE